MGGGKRRGNQISLKRTHKYSSYRSIGGKEDEARSVGQEVKLPGGLVWSGLVWGLSARYARRDLGF